MATILNYQLLVMLGSKSSTSIELVYLENVVVAIEISSQSKTRWDERGSIYIIILGRSGLACWVVLHVL